MADKAVHLAKKKAQDETKLEYKIADALTHRYKRESELESSEEDVKCFDKQGTEKKMCVDAIAYADAMEKLYENQPSDDDVATLYAAAEMNINPWRWWINDKPTDKIKKSH